MGLLANYLQNKDGSSGNVGDSVLSGDSSGSSKKATSGGLLSRNLPSFHKGGMVKKTGPANLKKGERVMTKKQQKSIRKKAC